ncbi:MULTISPECIES: DUF3325 domain-containing protein [unclassified Novosphingobium]|uniref:DUF3325 domain-containing protein n=1 Tax=unclassified Novosphingobium TaxID=2644732 RepID=UPI0013571B0F|nr:MULTISPECIES: DUF3325 domain-containing protein [unclassified Novosphingobium]
MIHALAIALACAAFLMLAASMKRHQRDLVGRAVPEPRARLARIAGWVFIAVCWSLEAVVLGPALGTIVWIGELSMGAWLAIAFINWRSGRPTR